MMAYCCSTINEQTGYYEKICLNRTTMDYMYVNHKKKDEYGKIIDYL